MVKRLLWWLVRNKVDYAYNLGLRAGYEAGFKAGQTERTNKALTRGIAFAPYKLEPARPSHPCPINPTLLEEQLDKILEEKGF